MEITAMLSFLGASVLLTFMPGPDNIFVLTESLTYGRKNGILISIGLSSGVLVHTMAAATGLSIIIQQSAMAFGIMKYLGAIYLFYLAYKSVKEEKGQVDTTKLKEEKPQKALHLVRKGFLMNVLNPKVALFFIAFLPQFISTKGYPIAIQMFILGLIFALQALFIFCFISYLSGSLTKYISNSRFWNITRWSKIGLLSGLGLMLLLSKR